MADEDVTEPLTIEERLVLIENMLFHFDFADPDELSGEQALARSVNGLTATAATLASVLAVVQKNQAQLVGLERTAEANSSAISHSSTKEELTVQVGLATKKRKQDKIRIGWIITVAMLICLSLIGNNIVQFISFKNDRHDMAVAYSKNVENACEQRNETWAAINKFLVAQKDQVNKDKTLSAQDLADRLGVYNKLLSSIPVVDCIKLGTGLAGGSLFQGDSGIRHLNTKLVAFQR